MPTENTADMTLQQRHLKRMSKGRKYHAACENHPVSHKVCKSHRNNVTGCWEGSWDVKVTLCCQTDCKITIFKLQITPGISNCSFEPIHRLLQLISG